MIAMLCILLNVIKYLVYLLVSLTIDNWSDNIEYNMIITWFTETVIYVRKLPLRYVIVWKIDYNVYVYNEEFSKLYLLFRGWLKKKSLRRSLE